MAIITHNMTAMNTERHLEVSSKEKKKSTERLSSGYRINRSADDAAGLQISEKMRITVRGLNKASRNIQDGNSMIQAADGALMEVHDILQRMNELSTQAANDTNSQDERNAIDNEIKELRKERNISLMALGKAIGVTDVAVMKWEKNISEPTASNIKNLAIYFDVSTDYLLGIENYDYTKNTKK